jgi:hypothetical protein
MAQLAVAVVMGAAQIYKGAQQKKLKEQEAVGYRDAARRRLGVAHREMAEERRNKEFMYSRALAVMGAQGATQADPGINALLADLNAEGEYRVLSRLWAGQNEAEGLQFRADAAIREGRAAVKASYVNAVTSAVSAYYGMGGKDTDTLGRFSQKSQMERGLTAAANDPRLAAVPGRLPSYGPRSFAY